MAIARPKLLVVEDDPGLQAQLKWAYEDFDVIIAGDRAAAMAALRAEAPAVVTVVEPAEWARLVAGTRRALTSPAGLGATGEPAVDLAAVAAPADMEDHAAPPASTLPKAVVHCARICANHNSALSAGTQG